MPLLPPNQQLAAPGKWPIVGERLPRESDAPWRLEIAGCVARPRMWSLAELVARPQVEQVEDIHCVTRWSKLGVRWRGVPLAELLAESEPLPTARFVSFIARSARNHSTSLPLAEALALGALVVLGCDGGPLGEERGGPIRSVVPGRYFYKSVKWLERIELLADDRLGYWESAAGYHNGADPWREERYLAPTLTRQEMAALLATRDWSGRDLRSIVAAGHDLTGLVARGALLRDADLRGANLSGADLSGANLSNARLGGANLHGASLQGADVEGADFAAADLRGVDFRGASLLGVTFRPPLGLATHFDAATRFDPRAAEQLCPEEGEYLRGEIKKG